jgi:ABC-type microcin C transport system duplicated ATPase subunit YejF
MGAPILSAKDVVIKFSLRGRVLTAIRGASLDLYEGQTLANISQENFPPDGARNGQGHV